MYFTSAGFGKASGLEFRVYSVYSLEFGRVSVYGGDRVAVGPVNDGSYRPQPHGPFQCLLIFVVAFRVSGLGSIGRFGL